MKNRVLHISAAIALLATAALAASPAIIVVAPPAANTIQITGQNPPSITISRPAADVITVEVPGPQGPLGPPGVDGRMGVDGQAATITVGTVTTPGDSSVPAAVENVGTSLEAILNFTLPRGLTGDPIACIDYKDGTTGSPGPRGPAATISVGSTTTGAAGSAASVVNTGSLSEAILGFTIPRGYPGSGVPTGGTTGQLLKKASETDYDTTWADQVILWGSITGNPSDQADMVNSFEPRNPNIQSHIGSTANPHAVTANQVLPDQTGLSNHYLKSTGNGAFWATVSSGTVPAGGGAGWYLRKASSADYDTEWFIPPQYMPQGGTVGQLLQKNSSTHYDVGWTTPNYEPAAGNPSVDGYCWTSTAAGVRSWGACGSGGGTPGGATKSIQYNNNGSFAGFGRYSSGCLIL